MNDPGLKKPNWLDFFQRDGAKGVMILTLSTAFSQLINLLFTPILTRLYSPSDYGIFAVFGAFVGVFSILFSLRYETIIMLPHRNADAFILVRAIMWLGLFLSSICLILNTIIPNVFYDFFSKKIERPLVSYSLLASFGTSTLAIYYAFLNRHMQYKKIALLKFVQSLSICLITLVLGFFSIKQGLIWSNLLGLIIIIAYFIFKYSHEIPRLIAFNPRTILHTLKKYSRAPKYLFPTALLDAFSLQLPFILISIWFTNADNGNFKLAWTIIGAPGSLIGAAYAQVFFQKFSANWPDYRYCRDLLIRSWKLLFYLGLIPCVVFIIAGKFFFVALLGEQWAKAGEFGVVLAPLFLASLVHSPTSTAMVVLGMEKKLIYFGVSVLIYRPLSLYIGYLLNDIILGVIFFVTCEFIQIIFFQSLVYRHLNSFKK